MFCIKKIKFLIIPVCLIKFHNSCRLHRVMWRLKKKKFSRKSKSTLLSKQSSGMNLRHIETQNSKSIHVLYLYRFPKLSENLCNAVCDVYKFAFFMLTFYVILGICWEFLDVSYKYILSVGINWWSSNCKLSQNENRYLCLQWSHKSRKKIPTFFVFHNET